jgi:hypothetical protein
MTPTNEEIAMAGTAKDIKPGAKLDPNGTALVKRMKEVAQQAKDSDHVGHIRIVPKNLQPSDNCACMCGCS